jgi:Ice-binding-like
MSRPTSFKRGLAGTILAVFALFVLPVAAQASAVNLATASPFVVLGGTTVTNEGTSVLNGQLGVSPGTELTGFGPAVVNGAIHENDAVAAQAQLDLTTAYNVAAGQPVAPADDLSNTDLGNRTLTAGAYRYTAGALLTGPLTLDAQGDPNAQFVFEIGAELTTESASSVLLINGASPCNVYWQVGSSADLGTTTKFVGNLMALSSISLKNAATVEGRMLARNGQVSLINNVLTAPLCATGSGSTPPVVPPPATVPAAGSGTTAPAGSVPPRRAAALAPGRGGANGKQTNSSRSTRLGRASLRPAPREACTSGFRATVSGKMIRKVVFSLDGKKIGSAASSPFRVSVRAAPGAHQVSARVIFKDATPTKTVTVPYRACAAAALQPHPGTPHFTG